MSSPDQFSFGVVFNFKNFKLTILILRHVRKWIFIFLVLLSVFFCPLSSKVFLNFICAIKPPINYLLHALSPETTSKFIRILLSQKKVKKWRCYIKKKGRN